MPIYEYQCQACQHPLEVLQKLNDAPLSDCPACGEPALKKLISASVFRLKGGGWYETDFKTGDKKNLVGDPADAGKGDGAREKAPAAGGDKAEAPAKPAAEGAAKPAKPAAAPAAAPASSANS